MDYQKALTNQLGNALEKEAGPADFSMLINKDAVQACWLQEKPADIDSQARRPLKNPTGSMSASDFADEKTHLRKERDSAATVVATAKRAKKTEWGLCGVNCQCVDPSACPVKDKAECPNCGRVQSKATVNPVCGRCKKLPLYKSTQLVLTNG